VQRRTRVSCKAKHHLQRRRCTRQSLPLAGCAVARTQWRHTPRTRTQLPLMRHQPLMCASAPAPHPHNPRLSAFAAAHAHARRPRRRHLSRPSPSCTHTCHHAARLQRLGTHPPRRRPTRSTAPLTLTHTAASAHSTRAHPELQRHGTHAHAHTPVRAAGVRSAQPASGVPLFAAPTAHTPAALPRPPLARVHSPPPSALVRRHAAPWPAHTARLRVCSAPHSRRHPPQAGTAHTHAPRAPRLLKPPSRPPARAHHRLHMLAGSALRSPGAARTRRVRACARARARAA
jgi:hypothetical protein